MPPSHSVKQLWAEKGKKMSMAENSTVKINILEEKMKRESDFLKFLIKIEGIKWKVPEYDCPGCQKV